MTAHSAPKDGPRDHEHWPLIALLKAAFAQELFDRTDWMVPTGEDHFERIWAVARSL